MAADNDQQIFISYATADGKAVADDLRRELLKDGYGVWQDIVALRGGVDWWSQIEKVLRSRSLLYFILVVTPAALKSSIVRREIKLARQEGKILIPVKGPGLDDLDTAPRWMGHVLNLEIAEHKKQFILMLDSPVLPDRVPMMAPEPPPDLVMRPIEYDALKAELLSSEEDARPTTVALCGAGGYGKSTLAKALSYEEDVLEAYFDGVLWVELGEEPDNVLARISDLIKRLTGEQPGLETLSAATGALGEALGDRRILLVIDDVWRERDLLPFMQGGSMTSRLITTRNNMLVPADASIVKVDSMRENESYHLLRKGLPQEQVFTSKHDLHRLVARLGEWPLLLKLVNGYLRRRVRRSSEKLDKAVEGVNKRLDAEGFLAFDSSKDAEHSGSLTKTISISLDALTEGKRRRFLELAVFPEDADIPVSVAAMLWEQTSGLDVLKTEDLLLELFDLSLLLDLDLENRTFRIHDVIRSFLVKKNGRTSLAGRHEIIVDALTSMIWDEQKDSEAVEPYAYTNLPYHMWRGGRREELQGMLLDLEWLQNKLDVTGDPLLLVADYNNYGSDEAHSLIQRTLRLIADILIRDRRQLKPQLYGRLIGADNEKIRKLCAEARRQAPEHSLYTKYPSLTPPGAEILRLEGHEFHINSVQSLDGGRLASAGQDKVIRIWNVEEGSLLGTLSGHEAHITTLAWTADSYLISGDESGIICVWDVELKELLRQRRLDNTWLSSMCVFDDGRIAVGGSEGNISILTGVSLDELQVLKTSWGGVKALTALPGNELASGHEKGIICLWRGEQQEEPQTLEWHTGAVNGLALLPDGRQLASCSSDKSVRLWDITVGAQTGRFEGHTGKILSIAALSDGRIATGSEYSSVRIWDLESGKFVAKFEGHTDSVASLTGLPGGRIASGSYDGSVRIWDSAGAAGELAPGTHDRSVRSLFQISDGRLATGSKDGYIGFRDVYTGVFLGRSQEKAGAIWCAIDLADGRIATGDAEGDIYIGQPENGSVLTHIKAYDGPVSEIIQLTDGRVASASHSRPVRIWDADTGELSIELVGKPRKFVSLTELADGRIAAVSIDQAIYLWDKDTGVLDTVWQDGAEPYSLIKTLSDGTVATGSFEGIIRLWSPAEGCVIREISGHRDLVTAIIELPHRRIATASVDQLIRIYDLESRTDYAKLEVDAPVHALARLNNGLLVAGDGLGRLHWLEMTNEEA